MRTDISTLVTLDTVLDVPYRNEGLNTALLVSGCTNLPRTVDSAELGECADGQQIASLSIDRTNHFLHESGSIVLLWLIIGQVSPLGLHGELLVLTTTVDSSVVLVNHVLTLSTV